MGREGVLLQHWKQFTSFLLRKSLAAHISLHWFVIWKDEVLCLEGLHIQVTICFSILNPTSRQLDAYLGLAVICKPVLWTLLLEEALKHAARWNLCLLSFLILAKTLNIFIVFILARSRSRVELGHPWCGLIVGRQGWISLKLFLCHRLISNSKVIISAILSPWFLGWLRLWSCHCHAPVSCTFTGSLCASERPVLKLLQYLLLVVLELNLELINVFLFLCFCLWFWFRLLQMDFAMACLHFRLAA